MSKHTMITGNDLRIARIIYGFDTQEQVANELEVSLATVQRYEAMPEVDAKILGTYEHVLNFDVKRIAEYVDALKLEREKKQ